MFHHNKQIIIQDTNDSHLSVNDSKNFTRRDFLKLGGLAGACTALGTLWPLQVQGGKPSVKGGKFRFIHYTDIHVEPERNGERGYAQAIAHMNTQHAAFAISGGDLVFDSLSVDSDRCKRLWNIYLNRKKDFQMPVYETMGNHDNFGLSNKNLPKTEPGYGKQTFLERFELPKTYRSFNHANWHFIVLDSIKPKPEGGWEPVLDEAQFEWLKSDLEANKGRPKIVTLHVPVVTFLTTIVDGPFAAQPSGRLMHDTKALRLLFEANNVKLVLQGHNHIREHFEYNGVNYISGGAVCGAWWKGPHLGHPEGYATIDVEGDSFKWNYHTYGWVAKQNAAFTNNQPEVFALL